MQRRAVAALAAFAGILCVQVEYKRLHCATCCLPPRLTCDGAHRTCSNTLILQSHPHCLDVGVPVHPRCPGYLRSLRCSSREEHGRTRGWKWHSGGRVRRIRRVQPQGQARRHYLLGLVGTVITQSVVGLGASHLLPQGVAGWNFVLALAGIGISG